MDAVPHSMVWTNSAPRPGALRFAVAPWTWMLPSASIAPPGRELVDVVRIARLLFSLGVELTGQRDERREPRSRRENIVPPDVRPSARDEPRCRSLIIHRSSR